MSPVELIQPTEQEEEQDTGDNGRHFLHAFCILCNEGKEMAVSMCGAKQRRMKDLLRKRPEGEMCVVCQELVMKPCKGCGS